MRRRGLQGPALDLDDGHEYRSTWERNVARVLRYRGVEASYEPKRYLFDGQPWAESYLPDWRLPGEAQVGPRHYDTILLEVKGYYDAKSKRRSRNMKKQWAARGVMVLLFREPLYRQLEEDYAEHIPEWEYDRQAPARGQERPAQATDGQGPAQRGRGTQAPGPGAEPASDRPGTWHRKSSWRAQGHQPGA